MVPLKLSGQADRVIDVSANVVEQKLILALPDGGGDLSKFRSVPYITAIAFPIRGLVNNGRSPSHSPSLQRASLLQHRARSGSGSGSLGLGL